MILRLTLSPWCLLLLDIGDLLGLLYLRPLLERERLKFVKCFELYQKNIHAI